MENLLSGIINLQATCDPTVQLCDQNNSTNSTWGSNSTNDTNSTDEGILAQISKLTGVAANTSLPIVGAFQVLAGGTIFFERGLPSGSSAAEMLPFYTAAVNAFFGTAGLSYGLLETYLPTPFGPDGMIRTILDLSTLLSGGVSFYLFYKAGSEMVWTAAENIIVNVASALAVAFGLIHALAFLGPKE